MTVGRSFLVTAIAAAIAISGAGPASAAPTMDGHYTYTSTAANGQSVTTDWYVAPCGDGCVNVTTNSGTGEARFVNGQWNGDATSDAKCADGTVVPNAFSNHYAWDPKTLAGTVTVTYNVDACGAPAGTIGTNRMQLRQVT
jgi:hypothetical protein